MESVKFFVIWIYWQPLDDVTFCIFSLKFRSVWLEAIDEMFQISCQMITMILFVCFFFFKLDCDVSTNLRRRKKRIGSTIWCQSSADLFSLSRPSMAYSRGGGGGGLLHEKRMQSEIRRWNIVIEFGTGPKVLPVPLSWIKNSENLSQES